MVMLGCYGNAWVLWYMHRYQESVQVGSSATASPATPDTGHEEMEGDIDDLLEWTNGLNYDE